MPLYGEEKLPSTLDPAPNGTLVRLAPFRRLETHVGIVLTYRCVELCADRGYL